MKNNKIKITCNLSDLTTEQQNKLLYLLYQVEDQTDYKNKSIVQTINLLQLNLKQD